MSTEVTVACVLRSGGVYTPEYVYRLMAGVGSHLSGHRFVCLSDVPVPCERIPLVTDWRGWWAKLELFRLTGKVLYLDLDTIVQGSLKEIADYPHRFTMLADFMADRLASGVMAWDGDFSHIFENFDPAVIPHYRGKRHGDQGYIAEQVEDVETFQRLFPGQIVSRKCHEDRSKARLICYHGHPKPHETGWAA